MKTAELIAARKRLMTVPCLAPGLCAGECINLISELIYLRQKTEEIIATNVSEFARKDEERLAVMRESLREWMAGVAIMALAVGAQVAAVAWIVL